MSASSLEKHTRNKETGNGPREWEGGRDSVGLNKNTHGQPCKQPSRSRLPVPLPRAAFYLRADTPRELREQGWKEFKPDTLTVHWAVRRQEGSRSEARTQVTFAKYL